MKLLFALLVLLAQDADDPVFKRWSASKPGSWVKYHRESVNAEGKVFDLKQEFTQTLAEIDDQKAVLHTVVEGGKPGKVAKDTYRAKRPLPDTIDKEGDEEIEVAGKKRTCHWVQGKPFLTGFTLARIYLHPDIPGGIARVDFIVLGEGKPHSRHVAVGWEKK